MHVNIETAVILMLIYVAIPAFCCLLFSFAYWGVTVKPWLGHMALFSLLFGLFTVYMLTKFPSPAFLVLEFAAHTLLFLLLFRRIPVTRKWMSLASSYVLNLLNNMVFSFISLCLLKWSWEEIVSRPLIGILTLYPFPIILLALSFRYRKKDRAPGEGWLGFWKNWKINGVIPFLLFALIQIVLLTTLAVMAYSPEKPLGAFSFLAVFAVGISILSFIVSIRWLRKTCDNAVKTTQELYIEDINQLFASIRGQRHDFLNHVQVIQSLVKMKKYEALDRYISEMIGEISEVNQLVGIGHPALSALIQSKLVRAEKEKIRFSYSFEGMEKLLLGLKAVDVVKIMGNLIDNAMDEVAKLPPDQRWVEACGKVEGDDLYLIIRNPGREIPPSVRAKMFLPGFTTKSDNRHSGLGLSIVKERVEYYKGAIHVESTLDKGTVFTIRIPVQSRTGGSTSLASVRESPADKSASQNDEPS